MNEIGSTVYCRGEILEVCYDKDDDGCRICHYINDEKKWCIAIESEKLFGYDIKYITGGCGSWERNDKKNIYFKKIGVEPVYREW